MASPRLLLPVDKVLPQALGAQHAPAPETDHAVPHPPARLAEREPAELQGRPRGVVLCVPGVGTMQRGRDAEGPPVGGWVGDVRAGRREEEGEW